MKGKRVMQSKGRKGRHRGRNAQSVCHLFDELVGKYQSLGLLLFGRPPADPEEHLCVGVEEEHILYGTEWDGTGHRGRECRDRCSGKERIEDVERKSESTVMHRTRDRVNA